MARGFNATLEVKCWKEHTCCYCGAAYRYLLQKQQTGRGVTQADAVGAARAGAVRALRRTMDMVPCPACGHYQPDMIGDRRLRRHAVVLLYMSIVLLLLFVLVTADIMPASEALWALLAGAVPAWIAYAWIAAASPNRSMRANKAIAERLVERKQLELVSAAGDTDDRPRPVVIETGAGHFAVCALLLATLALMPGAEYVRLANGWPSNPGWHPPIIGPGDQAWTWVEPAQPLETRHGEWRFLNGSASISMPKDQGEKEEKIPLTVSSRDEPLRAVKADDPMLPPRLWVRLQFPKSHKIRNREVRIELTMKIAVPAAEGPREDQQEITAIVGAHLGRPFAGFLYAFFWNIAVVGGGLIFMLAACFYLLSDAALKRTAPVTRVTAVTDEGSEPATATRNASD
jgi:hypothetical protein